MSHVKRIRQQFIDFHNDALHQIGRDGYSQRGRGAVVVLLRGTQKVSKVPVGYAALIQLHEAYPDQYRAQKVMSWIMNYEPPNEMLVLFYMSNQLTLFNRLNLTNMSFLDKTWKETLFSKPLALHTLEQPTRIRSTAPSISKKSTVLVAA